MSKEALQCCVPLVLQCCYMGVTDPSLLSAVPCLLRPLIPRVFNQLMGSQQREPATSRRPASPWDVEQEKAFTVFLVTRKSEAGDTMSFRNTVFTDAAIHINTKFPNQKGPQKSQSSCRSKWAALKKSYNTVKNIKTLSGSSWSDESGISLTPETSGAWEAHLKAHPQSGPFASKGFPLFSDVEELMLTTAKGKFVQYQPYARKRTSGSSSTLSMLPPCQHTLAL
ncbi:hypothetical protein EV702DRAFT_1046719 [Suillus placidus]|uniref:Myb/SANT-like domain-containing protein n=1 Tax=Suillus placidus TaxID=48579 RepID=A0A9P7D1I3_9AGAM|nr:hypothetical protein EV702DRAFT_1046719 [Suillus placidus]